MERCRGGFIMHGAVLRAVHYAWHGVEGDSLCMVRC